MKRAVAAALILTATAGVAFAKSQARVNPVACPAINVLEEATRLTQMDAGRIDLKAVCEQAGLVWIETDPTKPDGTMRKLMDVSRLAKMGWRAKIGLKEGLAGTYDWFKAHQSDSRGQVAALRQV